MADDTTPEPGPTPAPEPTAPPTAPADAAAVPPPPPSTAVVVAEESSGPPTISIPRPSLDLSVTSLMTLVLGALAVVGVVLGLLLNGPSQSVQVGNTVLSTGAARLWNDMGWTWAVLAIVCAAVVLLLPLLGSTLGLTAAQRAAGITAAVAVLVLWWVIFILPRIDSNRAFLVTAGVIAAAGAAWVSRAEAERAER